MKLKFLLFIVLSLSIQTFLFGQYRYTTDGYVVDYYEHEATFKEVLNNPDRFQDKLLKITATVSTYSQSAGSSIKVLLTDNSGAKGFYLDREIGALPEMSQEYNFYAESIGSSQGNAQLDIYMFEPSSENSIPSQSLYNSQQIELQKLTEEDLKTRARKYHQEQKRKKSRQNILIGALGFLFVSLLIFLISRNKRTSSENILNLEDNQKIKKQPEAQLIQPENQTKQPESQPKIDEKERAEGNIDGTEPMEPGGFLHVLRAFAGGLFTVFYLFGVIPARIWYRSVKRLSKLADSKYLHTHFNDLNSLLSVVINFILDLLIFAVYVGGLIFSVLYITDNLQGTIFGFLDPRGSIEIFVLELIIIYQLPVNIHLFRMLGTYFADSLLFGTYLRKMANKE